MMNWGTFGWGMGFGWIWMVFVWAVIIGGVVLAVKAASGRTVRHDSRGSAKDILKERYARGEITKDEFEQRKRELRNS